jgi:hypothetical protein
MAKPSISYRHRDYIKLVRTAIEEQQLPESATSDLERQRQLVRWLPDLRRRERATGIH